MSVSNWPCETTLPTSDDVKLTQNSDPLFFKLSRRNISQDTTAPFLKIVFTTSTFVLLFFRCTVVRVHTEPEILGQAGDHQHHHHNHQPNHDWGVGGGRWGGGKPSRASFQKGGKWVWRGAITLWRCIFVTYRSPFLQNESPPPPIASPTQKGKPDRILDNWTPLGIFGPSAFTVGGWATGHSKITRL